MDYNEQPMQKLAIDRIKAGIFILIGIGISGAAVNEYLRYIKGKRAYTMRLLSWVVDNWGPLPAYALQFTLGMAIVIYFFFQFKKIHAAIKIKLNAQNKLTDKPL